MIALAVAAAAAVAAAPAADDAVAPPLATKIVQSATQVRDDGRAATTFRIQRELVFAAEPGGFRLTVTQISAEADAPPDERSRYAGTNAALQGRPVVIHLDQTGTVRAIDDLDAIWTDYSAGVVKAVPDGGDPATDALRNRLAAMTPDQRRAMVGSVATELFAAARERRAGPAEPLNMASPPPFAGLTLTGTATATAEGGNIRVRSAMSGRSGADAAAATMAVSTERLVDVASGLVRASVRRETLASRTGKRIITTSMTLTW